MSRTIMTAAFAAMLAGTAPLAYGQTAATPSSPNGAAAQGAVHANRVLPNQVRATDMNGATIYDVQNQNIGDIKDIILDRDGRVAAVVLNVGSTLGVGGKYVAVAMTELKITDDHGKPRFTVNMTKEQLKSAQSFQLGEPNRTTGTSTMPREPAKSR